MQDIVLDPFLKWAGGKRWLSRQAESLFPQFTGRYFEPFLGGGAIFFANNFPKAHLSDANVNLISCYLAIRDHWEQVSTKLASYQDNHSVELYYSERSQVYGDYIASAAQFIYLNRTCWNGLYRVNLRGQFNVPIGTKTSVLYPQEDFSLISKKLRGVDLLSCDFDEAIERAGKGDLIFADPPYTTAHNMNGFVKYNENIFRWSDQIRLKAALDRAWDRGAIICMTNADHPSIRELYENDYYLRSISRPSIISGKPLGRKTTTELLITSYKAGIND